MGAQVRLVNITLLHFLTRIIFYVFVFVAGYISSRALSRHDFGELQYISLWVNLSWIFLGLGIPNTISRYFTRAFSSGNIQNIHKLVKYSSVALVMTLLLTSALFILLYRFVHINISFFPVLLMALSQCMLIYLQVFMQGLYRYKTTLLYNIVVSVTGTVFLLATINVCGAVAYVYTILLVNVILCLGYGFTIIKAIKTVVPESREYEEIPVNTLIRTSLFYAASAILAGILWQRFEISVLKQFFGYEKIAIYSIAFTVVALFAEPLKMLPGVLTYYFAGISDEGDKVAAQFSRYFKHFSCLVIFCGIFIWADARSIVTLLYTDKYLDSVYILRVLLIGIVPGICSYVLIHMHIGLGKAKFLMIQDLVSAVLFLFLFFLGNYYWQLPGIAWAKSIAMLVNVILGLWYTSYRLKFKVPYIPVLFSLLLSAVMVLPLSGVASSSILFLIMKGFVLFALYILISSKLKILETDLLHDMYKQIRSKITAVIGW